MLPLEGVRVVAVEQYGAGPFGTMQLADLGAEVVKVENIAEGGDVGRYVRHPKDPLPEGDPKVRQPDISRARELLGWEPEVPLEVGLKTTLDDFRRRLGLETAPA